MAKDRLQAREADPLAETSDAEGVAQDVRRTRSADLGSIRYPFDHEFGAALADADRFFLGEPRLQQCLRSRSHRNDSSFLPKLPFVVAPTFAVDDELMPLPVNVIGPEVDEFVDAKAGIKKRPND